MDLRRKDPIAVVDVVPDALLSPEGVGFVAQRFAIARDHLAFLAGALEIPF